MSSTPRSSSSTTARRSLSLGLIRFGAWLMLLGATTILVRAEVQRTSLPDGISEHNDIVYRTNDDRRVRLDLYLPADPAPVGGRPAIVAIHGGGWRGGSKRDMTNMAAQLAEHGYVVVAIDYRLSRPGLASWPENLEDCREAVRWIRRHAPDYGVNPDRIAALGVSAGGHLAALLGTYPEAETGQGGSGDRRASGRGSANVQAVVDFYGPTDLEGARTSLPLPSTPVRLLFGSSEAADSAASEALASPLRHVSSDDPPTLIIHGREDRLVPLEQSEAFARALTDAGVRNRLIAVDHATHGFGFHVEDRRILPEVLAFLDSVWNAKPEGLQQ